MKQPRPWLAWLAALMIAASLVVLPREGAAAWPPLKEGLPPGGNEGEPDGPPPAAAHMLKDRGPWTLSIMLQQGRLFLCFTPSTSRGAAEASTRTTRSARPE